ncbi:MAG: YwiC-like family protein [Anaeromyxobacter sp.]
MTTSAAPATPARPLIPREHGAWGQLALPLLAGLLLGHLTAAASLLTAAVVLAFVAHEPALVLLGHRGARVRAEEGARARRWLALLGVGAAACGLTGAALASPAARAALLLPATLAAVVAALVWRRLEKTVIGEVSVAAALAAAGWAVALAGGAEPRAALAALLAWILSFAAATLAVQVILERARSKGARDPGLRHAAGTALLLGGAVALAAAGLPWALPLATAPTALVSLVVCLARVSPRRLRPLGWTMVGSSLLTLLVLVVGLR